MTVTAGAAATKGLPSSHVHAADARRGISSRVVAATIAGNALEFFDFGVYAFFAPFIAKAFFPSEDPMAGLLATLAVFGIGFLFRPLGGILFGRMADRVGRKPAMLATIALITVGTLALAVTPSYASIGIAAPLIVVAARLIQGLALGGEVGPSTSYLVEAASESKRGLYASWQLASQGIAGALSGGLGWLMAISMPPGDLATWGWRVPFFAAVLLVPVAMYMRSSMPETLEPITHETTQHPIARISEHIGAILLSILVVLGGTISTYLVIFLSTTFAMTSLKFPPPVAFLIAAVNGLVTCVFSLVGGWLSDRYGRRVIMLLPRLVLLVGTYPAMRWLFDAPSAVSLLAVCSGMAAMVAVSGGASLAAVPEVFPARVRALGLSIAYAVGVAIFGGSTQLVVQWLVNAFHDPMVMAWYSIAASLLCLIGILLLPETAGRALKR